MGFNVKKIDHSKQVVVAVGLLLLLAAAAPAAQNPEEAFKSLFGEQIRDVSATSSFLDDVKLAGEIIKAASTSELPPELLTVMYNSAFDLASKSPGGYETAFDAMARLAGAVPAQEIKCRQKTLGLLLERLRMAKSSSQRQDSARRYIDALMKTAKLLSEAGNLDSAVTYSRKALVLAVNFKLSSVSDIRSQNSHLLSLRIAAKRRELLEKKLKTDPADDASRKKLIEIYLVDLDDPAAAGKLLNADSDEMLRTYVALAAKPADQLETAALGELAQWYNQFADGAAGASKVAMLRRSEGYYAGFLEAYTEKDTKRLKASLGLLSVRKKLAELDQSPGAAEAPPRLVSISDAWPCSTSGLAFVWPGAMRARSIMGGAVAAIARAGKPAARGKARLTRSGSMDLAGGAFVAAEAVNGKLLDACMKSNEFTVEALIKPDNITQSGPARIISFSQDGQDRNFTIGQEKSALVFRVRTVSSSDQNQTESLFKLTEGNWHHLVVTYRVETDESSGKTTGTFASYHNGREMASGTRRGGRLSGWKPMHLLFGDEYADKRDWEGQLNAIAIYTRAISTKEIAAKYKSLLAVYRQEKESAKRTDPDTSRTKPPRRDDRRKSDRGRKHDRDDGREMTAADARSPTVQRCDLVFLSPHPV